MNIRPPTYSAEQAWQERDKRVIQKNANPAVGVRASAPGAQRLVLCAGIDTIEGLLGSGT